MYNGCVLETLVACILILLSFIYRSTCNSSSQRAITPSYVHRLHEERPCHYRSQDEMVDYFQHEHIAAKCFKFVIEHVQVWTGLLALIYCHQGISFSKKFQVRKIRDLDWK